MGALVKLLFSYDRTDVRNFLNFLTISMRDRYLGSRLGMVWAILGPLLMMGIFTFVFGFVFKAKLPGADTSLAYVIWLIAGYGPWLFFSEGLSAGTSSFIKHSALIRNISFKRELLVFAEVLTGTIPMLVAIVFLAILLVIDGRTPNVAWLILPFVLFVQYILLCGLGLALGSLNVFVRDVMFALPNLLLMMLFASPIFYPITAFPEPLQTISVFNPIYVISEAYRAPILHGTLPPLWSLAYALVVSFGIFLAGLVVFRRLRPFFDSRI